MLVSAGLILAGCSQTTTALPTMPFTRVPATLQPSPTVTETPMPTATPTSTPTPTPDPSAGFFISSPLQDIPLSELSGIISNPFEMPAPGLDDAHHGVDFAYYSHGSHMQMEGIEIYSVMPGKIAGVVINRNPYGNMILIETNFSAIPPDFLNLLAPPVQATPYPYNPRLGGCTDLQQQTWSETPGSLYILYGHMQNAPALKIGDLVKSGDLIGNVGNTGASGNPHLHLEMRWGESGTEFASLSHYDGGATAQERLAYCTWRISGKYILLDPMELIQTWLRIHPATP